MISMLAKNYHCVSNLYASTWLQLGLNPHQIMRRYRFRRVALEDFTDAFNGGALIEEVRRERVLEPVRIWTVHIRRM